MKPDELHIKEVTFRRKFNLGNYETLDIEFVATVVEGQNHLDVAKALDKETVRFRKSRED